MFQLIKILLHFYTLCGDVLSFMSVSDPLSICSVRFGLFSSSY
jgi:hypothetical protein